MSEWGIFNDDSADHTAEESVEAGFYSKEEAEAALRDRYADEDDCYVHECEEPEDDEDEEDDDDSDTDEDSEEE